MGIIRCWVGCITVQLASKSNHKTEGAISRNMFQSAHIATRVAGVGNVFKEIFSDGLAVPRAFCTSEDWDLHPDGPNVTLFHVGGAL